ncbi:MAG: DNA-binding MarR family transcriptional regulator [Limisphaerales bacterium]|jgi:DNA-binding MarR family transcriptional regulator
MSTFDPYNHLGFLAIRMGKLTHINAQKRIAERGMSFQPSCISILAQLWNGDGINQKELSDSLFMGKSSINKMLLALEKDALITRKAHQKDRRNKLIFLTQKGRDFRMILEEGNKKKEALLEQEFSKKEIQTAKLILRKMMDHSCGDIEMPIEKS